MKDTFNGWGHVGYMPLNDVVNLIVTGRTAKEAIPDEWLFRYVGDSSSKLTVLDFGCGIGRNTFGMSTYAPKWSILGYDNDQMLSKVDEFFALHYMPNQAKNVRFQSSWDVVRTMKFDVVFCCLVLQHIHEDALIKYIDDFKHITNRLIVSGRRVNDGAGGKSTWSILEEQGLTPTTFFKGDTIIPYNGEGNPEDHNTAFYHFESKFAISL